MPCLTEEIKSELHKLGLRPGTVWYATMRAAVSPSIAHHSFHTYGNSNPCGSLDYDPSPRPIIVLHAEVIHGSVRIDFYAMSSRPDGRRTIASLHPLSQDCWLPVGWKEQAHNTTFDPPLRLQEPLDIDGYPVLCVNEVMQVMCGVAELRSMLKPNLTPPINRLADGELQRLASHVKHLQFSVFDRFRPYSNFFDDPESTSSLFRVRDGIDIHLTSISSDGGKDDVVWNLNPFEGLNRHVDFELVDSDYD